MKRVTASEARRSWFRLLDEVAGGAVVCIERNGRRIVLRLEEEEEPEGIPDYGSMLRVPNVERAHQWGWSWEGSAVEPVEEEGEG